jgi:hypothetical protein
MPEHSRVETSLRLRRFDPQRHVLTRDNPSDQQMMTATARRVRPLVVEGVRAI